MPDILQDLINLLGAENVLSSDVDRCAAACLPFTTEPANFLPLAVLKPAYSSQIGKIIKFCGQHSLSLRIRGANTCCLNKALPESSLVLDLSKLNKVLKIDPLAREATLQAGIRISELQKKAAAHSLSLPYLLPETNASLGGAVASNYWNAASLKYGSTANNVNTIKVWDGRGELNTFYNANGIYANLESTFPLANLFCGSLGELGVIEELTLRLIPAATQKIAIFATFKSGDALAKGCGAILQSGLTPASILTFNKIALEFVGIKLPETWLLLLEFEGNNKDLPEEAKMCEALLGQNGAIFPDTFSLNGPETLLKLPVKISSTYPLCKRNRIGCPPERLPALFEGIHNLEKQYNLTSAIFGPLICGQLQVISFGNDKDVCAQFSSNILSLALILNNLLKTDEELPAISQEWQNPDAHFPDLQLKNIFDPNGIFSDYKKQIP